MDSNLEPTTTTHHQNDVYIDDSISSTPYVSAPSSPNHHPHFPTTLGFFYSAPASPMHYITTTTSTIAPTTSDASSSSFEFEFSSRFNSPARDSHAPSPPSMSSADELFLNGQIRPIKLSTHLLRPQEPLPPLIDDDDDDDDDVNDDVFARSRLRNRSLRRRTRSLSPLRTTTPFDWLCSDDVISTPKKEEKKENEESKTETTPSESASSSRCSSAGRSSKRWVFLKDFLRSKSEGRSNNKFWQNISFSSPSKDKDKKRSNSNNNNSSAFLAAEKMKEARKSPAKWRSAHEMHYAANRAQAEEMRKKTYLPYRQGLLGCLGFNSKSYGALNGFARALNPVSSR